MGDICCHGNQSSDPIWIKTIVVPVIPMMVFGSNDLGGEFSQSDSLLSHALVGIAGITGTPWITRMLSNILIECSQDL